MSALIWLDTTNIVLFVYVYKNLSCINVTSGVKLREGRQQQQNISL